MPSACWSRIISRTASTSFDSLASRVASSTTGASVVEGFQATGAFVSALFPVHVQRQPLLQVLLGPDAVDALLCLAEAAVAPLHRVTRRPQQFVVQELQGLFEVRALQLVQRLAQLLEPP